MNHTTETEASATHLLYAPLAHLLYGRHPPPAALLREVRHGDRRRKPSPAAERRPRRRRRRVSLRVVLLRHSKAMVRLLSKATVLLHLSSMALLQAVSMVVSSRATASRLKVDIRVTRHRVKVVT